MEMVKKKALISALLVLVMLSSVHAQDIVEYNAHVHIVGMALTESVTINIVNNHETGLRKITYPFSGDIKALKTFDDRGGLESVIDLRGGKSYVSTEFRDPLGVNETATILYEFQDPDSLSFFNNTYILSTSFPLLANVRKFELTLRLPEGTGLHDLDVDVIPAPSEITSDGRAVILKWIATNPTDFRIFVRFENLPAPTTSTTTSTTTTLPLQPPVDESPWLSEGFILGLTIVMLFIFAILLFIRLRTHESIEGKIDILKEDEQLILKIVAEEDGIEQREIQRRTDFSKTKVSKILAELDKRGAIRKETVGKKNKIYLTEKLKD